jgi:hypothetical protein
MSNRFTQLKVREPAESTKAAQSVEEKPVVIPNMYDSQNRCARHRVENAGSHA